MRGVGIIGTGWFGSEHAKALAELSEARLVASCGASLESAQTFAQTYGGKACATVEELLALPEVDIVLIATPHHLHTPYALLAAEHKKHILLEKPMAPTLADCNQILAAVEQAGVRFMLGLLSHFEQPFMLAKQLLDSGELGQPVLGQSTFAKFWMEHNRRSWHLDRQSGGGMLLTAGIHGLDRLMWLMDSRVRSVSAQFGTHFHSQNADDAALLFLRFEDGAAGTLSSIGYSNGAPSFLLEVTATKGRIRIDPIQGVSIGRNDRWEVLPDSLVKSWPLEPLITEWKTFIQAIQDDQKPAIDTAYARELMAVVFAAEESSRQQQEIRLQ